MPPRYGKGTSFSQNAPFTVGRGPVPRHAQVYQTPLLGPSDLNVYRKTCRTLKVRRTLIRVIVLHRDQEVSPTRQIRPTAMQKSPLHRDREGSPTGTLAGETRSDARVASEGPRATVTGRFLEL